MSVMSRRVGAHLIDFSLYNGISYLLTEGFLRIVYYIGKAAHWITADYDHAFHPYFSLGADTVIGLVFAWFYYVAPQARTGQTIGKRWMKIRVIVETEAGPVVMGFRKSIIRFLGYGLSYLLMGCGFLMAFFHPRRQALHDLMVGTVTIKAD